MFGCPRNRVNFKRSPSIRLGLILGRHIDGGMHEDIDITNYGLQKVCFNLELAIRSDFADLFEVKGKNVIRRGEIASDWSAAAQELTTTYRHDDFSRSLKVTARGQDSAMSYANWRLSFNIELQPGAAWHTCLLYAFATDEDWSKAPKKCVGNYMNSEAARAQGLWKKSVLKVEASNNTFETALAQAVDDMSALRLPIAGTDQMQFVPAAGLPWFVALFGRDSLIISLQNTIVHPEFARGALLVLARWQAPNGTIIGMPNPAKFTTNCGAGSSRFSSSFRTPLIMALRMRRHSTSLHCIQPGCAQGIAPC